MRDGTGLARWIAASLLWVVMLFWPAYHSGGAGVAEAAQIQVTLEITNTSMQLGGSNYTLSSLVFKQNGTPIVYAPAFSGQEVTTQSTEILGPFFMSMIPDELAIDGTKTLDYPPGQADVSFTISPLASDVLYDIDGEALEVTAHITEVQLVPALTATGGIVLSLLLAGAMVFRMRRRKEAP